MELGQVYTKDNVAEYMTSLFTLPEKSVILDPCFGRGAYIDALTKQGKYDIEGTEIDKDSYDFCHRKHPNIKLYNRDFFTYDKNQYFDGIIMNPPYVRHEEINSLDGIGINKKKLTQAISANLDAKANLYMYFIIYGIHLLKQNGEMVVIFPNSWEKAQVGTTFKKSIERYCSITEHIDVVGSPFHGDPIVEVEILKIVKSKNLPTTFKEITINENSLAERSKTNDINASLNKTFPLANIAIVRRGKTTGNNKMFINPPLLDKSLLVDIISSPKNVKGFSTNKSTTDKYLYVRSHDTVNGDTKKYLDECKERIMNEKEPKALYEAILTKQRWYDTSGAVIGDIVFPYIVRENIRFIKNDRKMMVRDNFYTINTIEDTNLMISLLNNWFVWYQLEKCGKTYGNNVLKLQKYDIDSLRIIRPNLIETEDKEALKNFGKELTETGNTSIIEKISHTLSKYYGVDNIQEIYYEARQKRLNK